MGIIGYGSIGRQVARIAQAMGMKVLACKRQPQARKEERVFSLPGTGDPEGIIPQQWFGMDEIEKLLGLLDIAVITLPLTESTRGLLNNKVLGSLPSQAYLINLGRGGTIDEDALIERLKSGKLAGAALDVFAIEPLPAESLLWECPGLLILPHIASWTEEQPYLASEVLIENLSRYLTGRPLVNLVNMKLGY